MSEVRLSYPACIIAGKPRLTSDDMMILRTDVFPEGVTSSDDVATLLAIHGSPAEKCPEWCRYFIESMTGFIVDQAYPQGSLDEINATWLQEMVSVDGLITKVTELDLLLHVIDRSVIVPGSLVALALDQIRFALTGRQGIWATLRGTLEPVLTTADMDFLYRVLRHACYKGRYVLAPAAVEALAAIDATLRPEGHSADWDDLMLSIDIRTLGFTGGHGAFSGVWLP